MRTVLAASLLLPVAVGLLYACSSDETTPSAITGTPDSGSTTPPTPTSTGTQPPPSSPPDSSVTPDAEAPFTPTTLGAKLVLWLEGDTGLTHPNDAGAEWKDLSTFGNNAQQESDTLRPEWIAGSGDAGANGHAVIRFNGGQNFYVIDNESLEWGTSDFALYAVVRHTNTPAAYGIIYGKWTDTSPFPGAFLWASYPAPKASNGFVGRLDTNNEVFTADAGLNDADLRLVSYRKTGSLLELSVNGTVVGSMPDAGGYDTTAFDAVGKNAQIGGRGSTFQALKGDIAALLAVKGTPSSVEHANVESYLKTKYGL